MGGSRRAVTVPRCRSVTGGHDHVLRAMVQAWIQPKGWCCRHVKDVSAWTEVEKLQ